MWKLVKSAIRHYSCAALWHRLSPAKLSTSTAATTLWEYEKLWRRKKNLTNISRARLRTNNSSRARGWLSLPIPTPGEFSGSWVSSLKALTSLPRSLGEFRFLVQLVLAPTIPATALVRRPPLYCFIQDSLLLRELHGRGERRCEYELNQKSKLPE